jgi:hypothetical protein
VSELPLPDTPPGAGDTLEERVRLELLVRAEVERQSKKEPERATAKEVLQHPATLLLLTFFLTSVCGSILTSWWQYQQWARQQQFRLEEQRTKEQLAVMNLTAQAVAESFASAEDVLHLFAWDWRPDSAVATLAERSAHWTLQSRRWRANEKILVARSQAAFRNKQVSDLLAALLVKRKYLGNDITNLLAIADGRRGQYSKDDRKEIDDLQKSALKNINEVSGRNGILSKLIEAMVDESRKNGAGPPPKPIWRWLWWS